MYIGTQCISDFQSTGPFSFDEPRQRGYVESADKEIGHDHIVHSKFESISSPLAAKQRTALVVVHLSRVEVVAHEGAMTEGNAIQLTSPEVDESVVQSAIKCDKRYYSGEVRRLIPVLISEHAFFFWRAIRYPPPKGPRYGCVQALERDSLFEEHQNKTVFIDEGESRVQSALEERAIICDGVFGHCQKAKTDCEESDNDGS